MTVLVLSTARLTMSLPRENQACAMLDFMTRNRDHLKPWNPPEPEGLYTLTHWHSVIEKSVVAFNNGTALRLWMSPMDQPDLIVGSIGFSQIFRGPFCSCVLGYQIDEAHEGQGLMTEALREAIRYMFAEQKLHRIAANYRPENVRSGRLLAGLGFRIEGFAKDYLFIDGAWRDHVLTSIANDAFNAGWLRETAKL